MQQEDASRTGRKFTDRFLEVEEIARRKRHADHAGSRIHARFLVVLLEPRSLSSFTLSRVEHEVDRQAVQPGRERALTTKEVQLLPRTNKDVLRQLLCALTVDDHSCAEGE